MVNKKKEPIICVRVGSKKNCPWLSPFVITRQAYFTLTVMVDSYKYPTVMGDPFQDYFWIQDF